MKDSLRWILPALLLLSLICLALLAYTPPIDRDGLIHHLQIPKLYLQQGGMYEIPELVFSYYPMNLTLLYMGALYLGSDILPKYIHMAFALATALLLFGHLKQRLPLSYAWLGALFFLTIPIIVKLSITVYVDLGLVFFSTAALLLLFRWLETQGWKNLLFAGLCCGLGVGTKYNGLLVLSILTAMIPILLLRTQEAGQRRAHQALLAAFLFAAAAVLAASPWLIKNALWTGNPIYPLYNSVFNPQPAPKSVEVLEEEAEARPSSGVRGVFATRYLLYGESTGQLLLLPLRIFSHEGQDDDPRYFDGRLNPFLLLLPLLLLLRRHPERKIRIEQAALAAFSLLYFLIAFNIEVLRIRYLVPMVPFLVILSMYGLHTLEVLAQEKFKQRHLVQGITLLPLVLLLAWNASYIVGQFQKVDPLNYISGRLSREEYLTRQLPEYRILQYANENLPESAKILCLFMGWRGYYLERPHRFDEQGNPNLLYAWLHTPGMGVEGIGELLHEQGFTHLLVRRDLLYFLLHQTQAAPEPQELWATLEKEHLRPLASDGVYALYVIVF
jgi:4-amino-4-deoxy-L-arabinose transferase-like glycosyltransferase